MKLRIWESHRWEPQTRNWPFNRICTKSNLTSNIETLPTHRPPKGTLTKTWLPVVLRKFRLKSQLTARFKKSNGIPWASQPTNSKTVSQTSTTERLTVQIWRSKHQASMWSASKLTDSRPRCQSTRTLSPHKTTASTDPSVHTKTNSSQRWTSSRNSSRP